MSAGLAYGIHVSNGSHQYWEALLMPFIGRKRSKCPCLLPAITLKRANSPARPFAGFILLLLLFLVIIIISRSSSSSNVEGILQVHLLQTHNDKIKCKCAYKRAACRQDVQARSAALLHNRVGQSTSVMRPSNPRCPPVSAQLATRVLRHVARLNRSARRSSVSGDVQGRCLWLRSDCWRI